MQTLKTLSDFRRHRIDKTLPQELLNLLEVTFHKLQESLGEDLSIEHFSLEQLGYFVILEQGDDLNDQREVGLYLDDRKLFDILQKWVELEHLPEGSSYYPILVLYTNEYDMFFFVRSGNFGPAEKAWLWEQRRMAASSVYPH